MTFFVENEGAQIAYEMSGAGPLVVLIPGGNGNSTRYRLLARLLAPHFTVVRVDRRAAGHSTGDAEADLDLAQAARDVCAVIGAVGQGAAIVFGSSAGAVIALKTGENHPEVVRQLLIHEPPVTEILPEPEASRWRDFNEQVKTTFDTEGAGPAMRLFASTMVGVEPVSGPADQAPETHARFLKHEFRRINSYRPDLVRLREAGIPITMLAGADSGDAYYVETARFMAQALPCTLKTMPGHHAGYLFEADAFAMALEDVVVA